MAIAEGEKDDNEEQLDNGSNGGGNEELEAQKDCLKHLLQTRLNKGETWYLIDAKWFEKWKKYVNFESLDAHKEDLEAMYPGPIDNSGLFKEDTTSTLKSHLLEKLDYVVLPKEAWENLVGWYGAIEGQAAVARNVVEHGMFVEVEVYLVELKLCHNYDMDSYKIRSFSRADTVGHVETVMREVFEILSETETRIWKKYMSNTYELLNKKEQSIQDSWLYNGQIVVIEDKNDDGTWTRETPKSWTFASSPEKDGVHDSFVKYTIYRKRCRKLEKQLQRQQEINEQRNEENRKLLENVRSKERRCYRMYKRIQALENKQKDEEDGAISDSSYNVKEGVPSTTAPVIFPSIFRSDTEPNFSFKNPHNCQASCSLSVLSFIFEELGSQICNWRFCVEMSNQLGNVGKCFFSHKDFLSVDLIEKDPVISEERISGTEAIDSALRTAGEKMKGYRHPAFLFVSYATKSLGHCVAIMPKTDKDNPQVCVEAYDVQMNKRWPQCDKHAQSINAIYVYKVNLVVAKKWEANCGKKKCTDETCIPVPEEVGSNTYLTVNECPDSTM